MSTPCSSTNRAGRPKARITMTNKDIRVQPLGRQEARPSSAGMRGPGSGTSCRHYVSARTASFGSIRAALRAGSRLATSATVARSTGTATKTAVSVGLV